MAVICLSSLSLALASSAVGFAQFDVVGLLRRQGVAAQRHAVR
jgi:hypothetical protein